MVWDKWPDYVRAYSLPRINEEAVLGFLRQQFHGDGKALRTIRTYKAALTLPLSVEFGVDVTSKIFSIILNSSSLHRPAVQFNILSLKKVLVLLSSVEFKPHCIELYKLLNKTMFLICLALGSRLGELVAL